ncbi:MAG: dTDP-glucose 4,6-dehydratase [Elusimicrobia bacterium RIFCSPLOWO2_02_FULL_39_32]|nr:MAG: dTDP-glucose 4,6-dehydratase [Elusimicrobia bacterium GWA2_38_7]OGR79304.1 MAG: dTDP-glucose 4,6-dehydratase [Elusimicrobia bacterium RIFCSPHIGHO2_02_FULL_39_36]OGR93205.1 MAG: dTDP-glucose 4,6-dehydratase [Elusimicrobia bacterium RIFCSPLOWO2_02_FULL_39_32]OGR99430.1 MAG: dTDP-glucose 4,6-dehydratase [Elusimicrobia bacterium RIFCSPLOWO2_12_FULL_39_28]
MKILVTGGAGFIGSNFVRYWQTHYPKDFITILDSLSYAGQEKNLDEFKKNSRISFVKGDICNKNLVDSLVKNKELLFHFAAETHVDRSIANSQIFLQTNILGTQVLLESSKLNKVKKFVFISTDEVYGSIKKGHFREDSHLQPNSPYAASKASADLLCRAYWKTFSLPILVTRCCNNFGHYQFPEKVIPLFITNLIEGKKIPIYGNGRNVREWIYVLDHCKAIDLISKKGKLGEIYNIGTNFEISNIELAKTLLQFFNKEPQALDFVQDRLGHDFRYSLDSSKLRKLGWKPEYNFKQALEKTVHWYKKNSSWWKELKESKKFKNYYKSNYHSDSKGIH